MPIANTPDQLALQASIRARAKQAVPVAAVRGLEPGLPGAPAGAAEGEASQEFLLTRCLSIAGGTTQILGLPR